MRRHVPPVHFVEIPDTDEPRPVAPGFWVGGFSSRLYPPPNGWSVIVNCALDSYEPEGDVCYVHCGIEDLTPWDPDVLDDVYRRVVEGREARPGDVLVHCWAGVSRSVSVAVYLTTRLGVFDDPRQALQACRYDKSRRGPPLTSTFASAIDALAAHRDRR